MNLPLRNLARSLSDHERYIVLLSVGHGLTPTEVSLVLQLPEPEVRDRLASIEAKVRGLAAEPACDRP